MKEKILIAGGSGMIGTRLMQLMSDEYNVLVLSRRNQLQDNFVHWNPDERYIDIKNVTDIDHVINLAGHNIGGGRWTSKSKRQILDSRINSTKYLVDLVNKKKIHPKTFINASAIGYYGNTGKDIKDERSLPGQENFLSEVCRSWEDCMEPLAGEVRQVILRIGVVLATEGGALSEMTRSVKASTALYFGNGNQLVSWIHIDDVCGIITRILQSTSFTGIINAVADEPLINKDLSTSIKKTLGLKILMPLPSALAKLMLGEQSSLVLDSAGVISVRQEELGYRLQYPTIDKALSALLLH